MTIQEETRPGYKQTEVGVIPDDWEILALSELTDPTRPIGYGIVQTGPYILNGVKCIRVVDIIANKIQTSDLITTSEEISASYKRTVLRADDLVLALRGKIGAVAKVNQDLEGANLTRGVALLSRSIRYIPDFLQQFISSSAGHDLIEKNLNGSALQEIPIASLRRIPIPVPPLPEQHAIATALADADALIAALEGMITKKRDLKQAAMQHLLTGKTRLPGFSGEWEVKRLGDHVSFLKNGTLSRAQLAIDAPVKYLHYGDIHGSTSLWLRPKSAGMPCVDPELVASLDRLKDGDLIFADASEDLEGVGKSIEIADCIETEVVSGLHTIAARFDKEVLADGFKAYLQFMPPFRDHLRSMAAGTKVLATNRKHIGSAKLALPEPPEQTAIAEVLSDMDADLAALEAQAAKARAVKQGMMQELLTGRVRLV